jgi:hypothetical protein
MEKKLISIIVVVIFICVGLSGCNEYFENYGEKDKATPELPIFVIIEANAHVGNSSGEPAIGASVSFEIAVNGIVEDTLVRTTDSTGWTSFAVNTVNIPDNGFASCNVYLTNNSSIREDHSLEHSYAKDRLVDDLYYWSISARLVQ